MSISNQLPNLSKKKYRPRYVKTLNSRITFSLHKIGSGSLTLQIDILLADTLTFVSIT